MALQRDRRRMLSCMLRHGYVFALLLVTAVCVISQTDSAFARQAPVAPPLHTSGHDILDSAGHRVRLTSVNWYGFDQKEFVAGGLDHAPLATIVQQILDLGVNSVRLP